MEIASKWRLKTTGNCVLPYSKPGYFPSILLQLCFYFDKISQRFGKTRLFMATFFPIEPHLVEIALLKNKIIRLLHCRWVQDLPNDLRDYWRWPANDCNECKYIINLHFTIEYWFQIVMTIRFNSCQGHLPCMNLQMTTMTMMMLMCDPNIINRMRLLKYITLSNNFTYH